MTRAVNPLLGEDGYGDDPLPDPKIREQEVEPLLAYFAATSKDALTRLTHDLAEIELQYIKGAARGADGFSRASARAALDHVLKMPKVTCHDVMCLNERAIDVVINELWMEIKPPKRGRSIVERFYSNRLDHRVVRSACEAARTRLMNTTGADKDFALSFCASQLCKLYETVAGTNITLSNKGEHLAYVGAPCSMGGTFVFEALKLIVRPTNAHVEDAMGRATSQHIRDWIALRGRSGAVHTSRTGVHS